LPLIYRGKNRGIKKEREAKFFVVPKRGRKKASGAMSNVPKRGSRAWVS